MSDTDPEAPAKEPTAGPRKVVRRMKRRVMRRQSAPRTETPRTAAAPAPQRDTPATARDQDDEGEPIRRISRGERDNRAIDIPTECKKPGWDYTWWVETVRGQPAADLAPHYHASTRHEGGWRVQKNRDWAPIAGPDVLKTDADGPVRNGGQVLVGRPMHLTDEAKREDQDFANRMQRDRILGTLDGKVHNEQGLADIPGVRMRRDGKDLGLELEVRVGSNA
jgi:hypothetical protein